MPFCIITFPSTNQAMKAERALRKGGLRARTIPVPRHISSDCGIALRIEAGHLEECLAVMASSGAEHSSVVPEGA